MLKVLITGADSYIGTAFAEYLQRQPGLYEVQELDVRNGQWRDHDFSTYQVVFHVAGMVHEKETKKNRDRFFQVNRDLTCEVARKAKNSGIKQFVFLSTMSVYGVEAGVIDQDTLPKPVTAYGRSKYEAEVRLMDMAGETFVVSVLRPPMIYGKNCKGNYSRLRKLALRLPAFPKINNQRSMLYIENLIGFLQHIIDERKGGLFFPQNSEYVSTQEMVGLIATAHGKRIRPTKAFNKLLRTGNFKTLSKLFGDLVYVRSLPPDASLFSVCSFKESIRRCEELSK